MSVQTIVQNAVVPVPNVDGIMEAYEALFSRSRAERKKLRDEIRAAVDTTISMKDVFAQDDAWLSDGWPALGLAPYKASTAYVRMSFYTAEFYALRAAGALFLCPRRKQTRDREYSIYTSGTTTQIGETSVPLIPKSLLPWDHAFRKHQELYVLFDTASWTNKKVEMVDPYLLSRIGTSDRFKIVAHWDLTDKERRIMELLQK